MSRPPLKKKRFTEKTKFKCKKKIPRKTTHCFQKIKPKLKKKFHHYSKADSSLCCGSCNFQTKRIAKLWNHFRKTHVDKKGILRSLIPDKKYKYCMDCGFKTTKIESLQIHWRKHKWCISSNAMTLTWHPTTLSSMLVFNCKYCGHTNLSFALLLRHVYEVHKCDKRVYQKNSGNSIMHESESFQVDRDCKLEQRKEKKLSMNNLPQKKASWSIKRKNPYRVKASIKQVDFPTKTSLFRKRPISKVSDYESSCLSNIDSHALTVCSKLATSVCKIADNNSCYPKKCNQCGIGFSNLDCLSLHLKESGHKLTTQSSTKAEPTYSTELLPTVNIDKLSNTARKWGHFCIVCDSQFATKTALVEHIRANCHRGIFSLDPTDNLETFRGSTGYVSVTDNKRKPPTNNYQPLPVEKILISHVKSGHDLTRDHNEKSLAKYLSGENIPGSRKHFPNKMNYICPGCGTLFYSEDSLTNHLKSTGHDSTSAYRDKFTTDLSWHLYTKSRRKKSSKHIVQQSLVEKDQKNVHLSTSCEALSACENIDKGYSESSDHDSTETRQFQTNLSRQGYSKTKEKVTYKNSHQPTLNMDHEAARKNSAKSSSADYGLTVVPEINLSPLKQCLQFSTSISNSSDSSKPLDPQICGQCSMEFSSLDCLLLHLEDTGHKVSKTPRTADNEPVISTKSNTQIKEKYLRAHFCLDCKTRFKTENTLVEHIHATHHRGLSCLGSDDNLSNISRSTESFNREQSPTNLIPQQKSDGQPTGNETNLTPDKVSESIFSINDSWKSSSRSNEQNSAIPNAIQIPSNNIPYQENLQQSVLNIDQKAICHISPVNEHLTFGSEDSLKHSKSGGHDSIANFTTEFPTNLVHPKSDNKLSIEKSTEPNISNTFHETEASIVFEDSPEKHLKFVTHDSTTNCRNGLSSQQVSPITEEQLFIEENSQQNLLKMDDKTISSEVISNPDISSKEFLDAFPDISKTDLEDVSQTTPFCEKPFNSKRSLKYNLKSPGNIPAIINYQTSNIQHQKCLGESSKHLLSTEENPPHKCLFCKATFASEAILTTHLKSTGHSRHTQINKLPQEECPKCGKKFFNKESLQQHLLSTGHKVLHKCSLCKATFVSEDSFKNHLRSTGHNLPPGHFDNSETNNKGLRQNMLGIDHKNAHECTACEKTFTSKHSLKNYRKSNGHISNAGNVNQSHAKWIPQQVCRECYKHSSNKESLQQHSLRTDHQSSYERLFCRATKHPRHAQSEFVPQEQCPKCYKQFFSKESLQQHLFNTGHNSSHECSVCRKLFTSKESLKNHRKSTGHSSHARALNIPQEECPKCYKQFLSKEGLQQHLSSTGHNSSYECAVCKKIFTSKDSLKNHGKSTGHSLHPQTNNISQEEFTKCYKQFLSKESLQQHLSSTGHNSSYECSVSTKKITSKDSFKSHEKSTRHFLYPQTNNIPQEECTKCYKQFLSKESLQQHLSSTGHNSSYECAVCKKIFTSKDSLKNHEKSTGHSLHPQTNNISQEECTKCYKQFLSKESLQQHLFSTGHNSSYECSVCKKLFTSRESLKNHRKSTGHSNHA